MASGTQGSASVPDGPSPLHLLDNVDVGVAACDAQGRLTLVNAAARRLLGLRGDAPLTLAASGVCLTGSDGLTPLEEEDLPLARALREGEVHDLVLTVTPDGQPPRVLRGDARVLRDEVGAVLGAVVSLEDVTDRVLAARDLALAHERATAIVTTSTDAFVAIDEAGRVTDWNPAAERSFGWSAEQAQGRDLGDLVVPGHAVGAHRRGVQHFVVTGEQDVFDRQREITVRHRDGRPVPVELTVWPTRTDTGWRFNAFLRDISERLTARAELAAAHAEIAAREAFTRVLLDTIDVAIVTCDADGRPGWSNTAGRVLLGEAGGVEREVLDRALTEGAVSDLELTLPDGDGPPRRLLTHARALRGPDGALLGAVCASHDVTDLRERERALRASEARFRTAFENGPLPMARLGTDGRVLETNPALRRLLSLTSRQLEASTLAELCDPADVSRAHAALGAALTSGSQPTELRLLRVDHAPLWCDVALTTCTEADGSQYVLGQLADMTDRKRQEQELIESSRTDALTGLRNREALTVRLQEWLAPGSSVPLVGMLFLDLDEFKAVNDTLGHEAGDAVLVEVARRLRSVVRPQDLLVRLGGDEFVVVCADLPGNASAALEGLASRLAAAVEQPVVLPAGTARVGASIGTALARPGQDAASVLAEADRRMYERKGRGRAGRPAPSTRPPARRPAASRASELVRTALEEERLFLEYQPLLDLATGAVLGVEALLRMHDRAGGVVTPDRFVPVAEASGDIVAMGEWVLERALVQTARWKRALAPGRAFSIGVNVSPRQFDDPATVERLRELVAGGPVEGASVVLEVTEGALLADAASVRRAMESLARTGAHLAVDDFGTGFASARYLLTLPFDTVKVDRSYVSRLAGGGREAAVARGLCRMAVTSGLHVVAEGIETVAEQALVQEQGLTVGQGYLFSQPRPAEALARLLLPPPVPRTGGDAPVALPVGPG